MLACILVIFFFFALLLQIRIMIAYLIAINELTCQLRCGRFHPQKIQHHQ